MSTNARARAHQLHMERLRPKRVINRSVGVQLTAEQRAQHRMVQFDDFTCPCHGVHVCPGGSPVLTWHRADGSTSTSTISSIRPNKVESVPSVQSAEPAKCPSCLRSGGHGRGGAGLCPYTREVADQVARDTLILESEQHRAVREQHARERRPVCSSCNGPHRYEDVCGPGIAKRAEQERVQSAESVERRKS